MKLKRLFLLTLVLFVGLTPAFSQRSSATRHLLTVNSNVANSQVFVNAVLQKGTTPMRLTLNSGSYSVTVRAPGYRDYVANINLNRNLTLNATLQPVTYALTINSNVRDSAVFINNQRRGNAPLRLNLQGGRYSIRVESDGYYPKNQVVQLERDSVINVSLEPMSFRLNITSNVQGAQVFIDGNETGNVPLRVEIEPGQHSIRVQAPGYYDYNQVLNLQEDTNINVNLRRQTATVSFFVREQFLNSNVKNPENMFTIYVDGRRIPAGQMDFFEVDAGEHIIRIETGGLAFEAEYVFEPGMGYGLELDMLLLLTPAEG